MILLRIDIFLHMEKPISAQSPTTDAEVCILIVPVAHDVCTTVSSSPTIRATRSIEGIKRELLKRDCATFRKIS